MKRAILILWQLILIAAIIHITSSSTIHENEKKITKNRHTVDIAVKKDIKPHQIQKQTKHTHKVKGKHAKKTKRNAYSRNWQRNYYNNYRKYKNMPPYLVFNKNTGAYFPYYSYPSENSVRRNMQLKNTYKTIKQ